MGLVLSPEQLKKSSQNSREARYSSRFWLNINSNIKRVRGCGTCSANNQVTLYVNQSKKSFERSAGFSDLITCGSLWACPVCSSKITTKRALKLSEELKVWNIKKKGNTAFFTLTMSHTNNDKLSDLFPNLSSAWLDMTSGKAWKKFTTKYSVLSSLRATELTHSYVNGWHLHYHGVFLIAPGKEFNIEELQNDLFDKWSKALNKFSYKASKNYGVDVRKGYGESGLASYLTKYSGAAWEVSGFSTKLAKGQSRTPFAILKDLSNSFFAGDVDNDDYKRDLAIWFDFEKLSKGRRQFQTGKNFAALVKDDNPDEIVIEEFDREEAYLDSYYFNLFNRSNFKNSSTLLSIAENESLFKALDFYSSEVIKLSPKLTRPSYSFKKVTK